MTTPRVLRSTVSAALLSLLLSVVAVSANKVENEPVIDSQITLSESLMGVDIPPNIRGQLCLVSVRYYSFDGRLHQGQLVVNKKVKTDIVGIFRDIEHSRFPILKIIPISKYNFSDSLSMRDNNTSAFNYRTVKGTNVLSRHALGRAIDINPFLNPMVKNGTVEPEGATYNVGAYGTILKSGSIVKAFKRRGWRWGGDWKTLKDYQHFEK